jgi:hypothetical protein
MPRLKGFSTEDYELCEAINSATDGRLRPSEACDLAETWILAKLTAERERMRRLGYYDEANTISNLESKIRRGEL